MPDRRSQGFWRRVCVMLLVCGCQVGSTSLAASPYTADTLKAEFLYRFAGYIDWPRESSPGAFFTIAVLGPSEVASELERLLSKRSIKGRPAVLRRIRDIRALGDAQILFIPSAYEDPRPFIAQVGSKPVLVVTEIESGLELGSALNFVVTDRRVRFEASLDAAERASLKISSDLLAVATRVLGGRKRAASFDREDAVNLGSGS